MATLETDEPRGPFLCGEFYVYRMASGWAVFADHYEPPIVRNLKTAAHALQWIYEHDIDSLRNANA